MFPFDGEICWSATDLTLATQCEFALLRALDVKLERTAPLAQPADPLMDQIAALGDQYEAELLATYQNGRQSVIELPRAARPYTAASLTQLRERTFAAFAGAPDVVYQAGFFDGEFLGYADFIEGSDSGWVVCDAKLARQARPKALIQLAAYADQLTKLGLPVAPVAALLLGSGKREEFALVDVLPIFRERRERLRSLLAEHGEAAAAVQWGDERYLACGSCAECTAAAEAAEDLILVAGLRMDQRKKLRASGITTLTELADATVKPQTMAETTFAKLRAQAALQCQQRAATAAGQANPVTYELTADAATTLALLPAPSPGDLFFDFEGDPLYNAGDRTQWGLEYLWGIMQAPGPNSDRGAFHPLWAHDATEEREALIEFLDGVAARRAEHPDMHIYHYAPYEPSALKRLVSRYQTHEAALDHLLRSGVFVDLYATVRGSIRVSQPSYSIKKLEPLYMGEEIREGDVQAGDTSVVEYHEYRALRDSDPDKAAAKLAALAEYNEYDCLSTLRLRDWLLARAAEAGVAERIIPRAAEYTEAESSDEDPLFLDLLAKEEPAPGSTRTPEQQAYALLAASLDYYRREERPFWWDHFDRLKVPVDEWSPTRDVFLVDSVEVVADWHLPAVKKLHRRELRLIGDWGLGSTLKGSAHAIYPLPGPSRASVPQDSALCACSGVDFRQDPSNLRVVHIVETAPVEKTHDTVPVALTPDAPPNSRPITQAIRTFATEAAHGLPRRAVVDLLLRRPPRLRDRAELPTSADTVADVTAALHNMDSSYLAIQGPPGSGKTHTGSRVIKKLVEEHGWRIGVVAQSHAVVEHILDAIVEAGLDPALVGKSNPHSANPGWTVVKNTAAHRATFLNQRADTGGVLGGTVWTFTSTDLIEPGGLDLLVIDEAGQFALAPTIGASVVAQRLLLLGDPQQLPQVSQGTHPEPVNESALGWLMEDHDTLPPDRGYFLGCSYRMHPDLCAKVSTLSYDGRLEAVPCDRELAGILPGLEVLGVDHTENSTESPEEAAAVVAAVRDLIGTSWRDGTKKRPLRGADVLVVAPYNAQVEMIRKSLQAAHLDGVRVGTVDKFQGQEAPVTIVSMTASSPGDVPRGMSFLLSRNRINVAISRAQWKALLIRSPALTSYMPATTDGVLELGAFIGLCEDADQSI